MKAQIVLTVSIVPRIASFMINNTSKQKAMKQMTQASSIRRIFSVASSTSTSTDEFNSIFGGDYAGQSATFSIVDGKVIPVPEHLVPESMVEWGQIPNCLECIVSEDVLALHADEAESDSESILERNVVTVMPEVGCGLDNLDTMKTTNAIQAKQYNIFSVDDSFTIATTLIEDSKRRIECIFTTHGEKKDENEDEDLNVSRTRVCINLLDDNTLKSPIEITKERKTSKTSTKGLIAKGGGLHASTVASLIGKESFNIPFCDAKAFDISELEGAWRSVTEESKTHERHGDFWNSDDGCTSTISLPGNVIVRNCKPEQSLEICLVVSKDNESTSLERIGATYTLKNDANELDFIQEIKL